MLTILKNLVLRILDLKDTNTRHLTKPKLRYFRLKVKKNSSIEDTRPLELKYLTFHNTLNR